MLQNNSTSMATTVETYLIEETVDLIYDNDRLTKWNDLVAKLNLEGQTKISTGEKSPIPFMHMNPSIVNVFTELCPEKTTIEKYNLTPIPIEILDLVALSVNEKYFSRIEIWADNQQPDPACVGVVDHYVIHKKGTYSEIPGNLSFRSKAECIQYISENDISGDPYNHSSRAKHYLIGRWADMKRSLAELAQMAMNRYLTLQGADIRLRIKEYTRELDDLESKAIQRFGYQSSGGQSIGLDLPF